MLLNWKTGLLNLFPLLLCLYKWVRRFIHLDINNTRISLVSDLKNKDKQGWQWTIPAESKQVRHFSVVATSLEEKKPDVYNDNLKEHVQLALKNADRQFQSIIKKPAKIQLGIQAT